MNRADKRSSGFWEGLPWRGLLAIVVWGASFVATRIALRSLSPFGLVAARLLAGALVLALAAWLRGGRAWPLRRDIPACTLLGILLSGHLVIQAFGLRYTSAINTGWIIGFIPVTIALGTHFIRQQRIRPTGWAGVAVGTGGVLVVTMVAPPDFAHARFGDFLQIVSCFTWTVYTLGGVGPVGRNGALRVTSFAMAVAAIVTTVIAAASGPIAAPVTSETLLAVGFLGVLCSGVAYYLWFAAQRQHGPARAGSLLYLEPFVTLITAAIILHENITPNAVVGGVVVLVGVWLVARGSERPREPIAEPG